MSAKSLLGAERKGFDAYILDNPLCPYHDIRKPSGKLSWSRAYINAWEHGYMKAANYFGDIAETNHKTWSVRWK